jgi:uncharacterized protein (TIGR03000 family)
MLSLRLTMSLVIFAIVPFAVAQGQEPAADSGTALLRIHLSPGASLEIDGVKQAGTGQWRSFRSPRILPGKAETFAVRVRWREGNSTVTVEREVAARAGEKITLDLRPDDLSPEERAILEQTNQERIKTGAAPLKATPLLCRMARAHAANMARQNQLNHTLDGKTMGDRFGASGYQFQAAGENIGLGARTPAEAVQLWMASPGHRANILNPQFQEIGIGLSTSAQGERYYAQVFARPR